MNENHHCEGFPPSVAADARVLILGSMPSVKSLAETQYYAHPQNRFWPLMAKLLTGAERPPADYGERLALLRAHHIALWDTIKSCERAGSLDSAIRAIVPNDITGLVKNHPGIRVICCNGGKSFACFKRYQKELCAQKALHVYSLPSTSPANARWRLPQLLAAWGKVILPAIR